MSRSQQVLYFACYALAAGAIAYAGPRFFPSVTPVVAWLIGVIVFLAGALLHEIAVRRYNHARDLHRLVLLHRAHNRTKDDVENLSREVAALRERVDQQEDAARPRPAPLTESETAPDPSTPDPAASRPWSSTAATMSIEEVDGDTLAAEVKVLHDLVQRLYGPTPQERTRLSAIDVDADAPLTAFSSYESREWLDGVRDALRQNRVELVLQPIVTLPQRKLRYFHCALGLKSRRGDAIPVEEHEDLLRDSGLEPAFRNMVLFRTIQSLRDAILQHDGIGFLCNVSPESFADREFFRDLLAYLENCDDLPSTLVLGFSESAASDLADGAAEDIERLVDSGFALCLNRPRHLDIDVASLQAAGVRMVKIDAQLLMPETLYEAATDRVRALKRALENAGIELIVDDIDTEQTLVELLDLDIDFGEGPLFGEAAADEASAARAAP
ncbi:MAG: EAL domain-containing protein [Alphaproteobacteria bacterium]|nr:EAL domain-containing protein [Alphaproteobacteria bacterium]